MLTASQKCAKLLTVPFNGLEEVAALALLVESLGATEAQHLVRARIHHFVSADKDHGRHAILTLGCQLDRLCVVLALPCSKHTWMASTIAPSKTNRLAPQCTSSWSPSSISSSRLRMSLINESWNVTLPSALYSERLFLNPPWIMPINSFLDFGNSAHTIKYTEMQPTMSRAIPHHTCEADSYVKTAKTVIAAVARIGSFNDFNIEANEIPTTKNVIIWFIAISISLVAASARTTASNPSNAANAIMGTIKTINITCTTVETRGLPRERYISLL